MRAYVIYGAILCILYFGAGMRGNVFFSMFQSAQWSPLGHGVHK